MSGPLSGVKVLDLSAVVSGPLTAALLADQGAEVIKIERIGDGDIQRHVGSKRNGYSGFFHVLNRGKKSLALDLGKPAAIEIVQQLSQWADVALQNFRPGVALRLGIGYEQLNAINDQLIYLSISGFGQTGPQANKRAYDPIIQTYSGMAEVQGRKRGEGPEQVNQLIMDKLTAYTGCQAITAALYARTRIGKGQHIELSMLDTAIAFMWADAAADIILQGDDIEPRPPVGGAGQLFEYSDGWGAIMMLSDAEFNGMCRAFNVEDISQDPRFGSITARMDNREAYIEVMQTKVQAAARSLTLEEARERLEQQQVPFARLRQLKELPNDPQVLHNQNFRELDHPVAGKLRDARPAPLFSQTPAEAGGPAPTVGEHTKEILALIGRESELESLHQSGVVGAR